MAFNWKTKKSNRVIKRRKNKKPLPSGSRKNYKFTKRRRFIIYEALRCKLPRGRAASLAGVSDSRVRTWIEMGKDKDRYPIHAEFRRRIKKIEAQHEQEALDLIDKASKGGKKIIETKVVIGPKGKEVTRIKRYTPSQWQAAAWFLERRHKEDYGREIKAGQDNQRSAEELAKEVKHIADQLFESVPAD